MPKPTALYTTAEAAKRLGVTSQTIRNWVRAGLLKAEISGKGGKWLIPSTDIDKIHHSSVDMRHMTKEDKERVLGRTQHSPIGNDGKPIVVSRIREARG